MKKLAFRRLSAPFVFGLLLRSAAAVAGHPGSCRSPRPRRQVRASRAGWTLALLAFGALAGSARTARAQNSNLIIDGQYNNSPYTYSDANGTQTFPLIAVGYNSTGTLNQTGGTINTAGMFIAYSSGSSGTYNLSGGSLNAAEVQVGDSGTGTVNQNGGVIIIKSNGYTDGDLTVGVSSGTKGTYNLGAGTISATVLDIGFNGAGTFNQTGAIATSSDSLVLGDHNGSNGTYNLIGGSLSTGTAGQNADAIGNNGTGVFNQTGGTFTASGYGIFMGQNAGSNGTYKLSAGSLSATYLAVANGGTGTFTQTGGTVDTNMDSSTLGIKAGTLVVGSYAGGTGTYNLSDSGQGSSLSTRVFVVGEQGTGTFNQTGGTFTTNGNYLFMGDAVGGTGTYNLNGGSLSTGAATIGNAGAGTFNQTGGTFTTNGYNLYVGDVASGTGTFNLSGTGSLSTGNVILGYDGTGTFNQSGGSFTTNGNYLYLGYASDGTGTYNLNGGVLTAGHVNGSLGTSTFNFNGGTLQAGGNNADFLQGLTTANVRNGGALIDTNGYNVTAAQSLTHSNIQGDNGTDGGLTKLGRGTLTLTGSNTYTGQTVVSQGTLAVNGGGIGAAGATANLTVNLGSGGTPAGTTPTAPALTLSGSGTQVFFNNAFVGSTAAGSVSQSGGTFTTGSTLYLGFSGTSATTGNGTYTLTGGTLNTNETQVGNGGTGTFTHSGGTQTVATTLYLGLNNGAGTYNLSNNGVLQASAGIVGYTGTGAFNQSGGTANFGSGGLTVGNNAGSQGTYGLGTAAGGLTATLNSSGPVYVGYSGTGTFNAQVNGLLQMSGSPLYLGYNAGSRGTFNSISGELHVGDGSTIGYAGTGVFNSTGGYESVAGTLVLGHAAGSSGTYNLVGGTLVAAQVGTQGGTSTFNFDNGELIPTASRTNFFQGLTTANVRNGGMTVDTQGYNVTVAQPLLHSTIQGDNGTDGGLTKYSAGTLTLTGANTYNGGTRVVAGTLLVNNTSGSGTGSGQVALMNTAILGGSGTVGGSVMALSGATVAPGAAAQLATARLTLGGTLTLQTNSLLAIKLGGATGGSGYDQVFAANGFALGGNLQVSLVNGFSPTLGQSFTILDNTSAGVNSGTFANAPGGLYTTAGGMQFGINYVSNADAGILPNDVTLIYLGTVVPEPGTWMLLGVGTGALGLALRRRRSAALTLPTTI